MKIDYSIFGVDWKKSFKWVIYTLSSNDEGVRYVGATVDIKRRVRDHVYRASQGILDAHKDRWIKCVIGSGRELKCTVIDAGNDGWQAAEAKWIAHFKITGCDLTNTTEGGEGCRGFRHSDEAKKAQSARSKGKKISDVHKLKISMALTGRPHSEERRAKMRGRRHAPESIRKMSYSQLGHHVSPETRAKISLAKKGVPQTEEALRNRQKFHTPEHRAAQSKAITLWWAQRRGG